MKKHFLCVFFVFLFAHGAMHADDIVDVLKAGTKFGEPGALFTDVKAEKQKRLDQLHAEHEALNKIEETQKKEITAKVKETQESLEKNKQELDQAPEDEHLKKKNELLQEKLRVLKDILREHSRLTGIIEEYIKDLSHILHDIDFSEFIKKNNLQTRLYYSFDDLQRVHDLILDYDRQFNKLAEEEKSAKAELENSKRSAGATEELRKKIRQRLEKSSDESQEAYDLIQLQEDIYIQRKKLDDLLVKMRTYQLENLEMDRIVAKEELDILHTYLRRMKPSIRVSDADITVQQEKFEQVQKDYYQKKDEITQQLEQLEQLEKELDLRASKFADQYGIDRGSDIDDFSRQPEITRESFLGVCQVGALTAQLQLTHRKIEQLNVQLELAYEQFIQAKTALHIKQSYYKITSRSFIREEDIAQEIKQYERPKSEAQAKLRTYKEKITIVADLLNQEKKSLDNLTQLKAVLQDQKATLFEGHAKEFNMCSMLLDQAEEAIQEQISLLGKLPGLYSGITSAVETIVRLIEFIVRELESITIWYRPEHAITWRGIQNIIPDIVTFFSDLRGYMTRLTTHYFKDYLGNLFRQPLLVFWLLLVLLFMIGIIRLIRRFIPSIMSALSTIAQSYGGVVRRMSLFMILILDFIGKHVTLICVWILWYVLLVAYQVTDPFAFVLFYISSIPILLYLAHRFLTRFLSFNREYDYALLSMEFQQRFILVVSVLMYSTIIIALFREAFMLNYYKSELPDMLLAINFIIFQISLIFLISKEQILNQISTTSDFWLWIREQVNRFYYVLLLCFIIIIVMSNPYVGFGRLVLHVIFGLGYTVALGLGLLWIYTLFKRIISHMFFFSTEEVIKERFAHAKTLFGLSLITAFILFSLLGFIIGAKIWGWPITMVDLTSWAYQPILLKETTSPISLFSAFKLILFIVGGFFTSYVLHRFVLERIFDLLLVDSGVQHTIVTIAQYIIVIVAVFFGFQSIGLGELVRYILVSLILGVGFILREPISDFMAYFIILVQRPVKIGDYIRLDYETAGVVRKITARSVIVRRKNSTTLIIPNRIIIAKRVENWNYTRNFIAFPDVSVIIDYRENSSVCLALLKSIVESHPKILKNPAPIIRLEDFGESGFVFLIRGFISSGYTLDQWQIASEVRILVAQKLSEHKVKLAVPIRMISYANELVERENKKG